VTGSNLPRPQEARAEFLRRNESLRRPSELDLTVEQRVHLSVFGGQKLATRVQTH
jgi:hypothetical protein